MPPWKRLMMVGIVAALTVPSQAAEPIQVAFGTEDGGEIVADLYGEGDAGVVLAHGAIFDKESWAPLARRLEEEGLLVLAIDFRGYGRSRAGTAGRALDLDVLAAIRYLHQNGAERVSVVGGSMGGAAAARAATRAEPGEIDRLLLLAAPPISEPAAMRAASVLYVVSEGDGLAARVRHQYDLALQPKRLEVVPGSAHAQHLFKTAQGPALTQLIVDFLTAPASGERQTTTPGSADDEAVQ